MAAVMGAIFSIASSLGLFVGLIIPLILPIAFAALEIYRKKGSPEISKKIEQEIKEKTSNKFVEEIIKIRQSSSKQIAKDIIVNLEEIQKAIDDGLNQEVNSLKDQVATVLSEKEKGESNVNQKLEELKEVSKTLQDINGNLDDLLVYFVQI